MKIKIFLLLCIVIATGTSCFFNRGTQVPSVNTFRSFRDIPGVTAEEIADIEALQKQYASFVYGVTHTTEAFLNTDGEIRGYAALLCEWLSELFGIPFILEYVTWAKLLEGLENGKIDFAGDLTPTEDRRKIYHMTSRTAHRWLCCFRLEDAEPLAEIARVRHVRYILIEQSTTIDDVFKYAAEKFEPVYADGYEHAYELLVSGLGDAVVTENTSEAFFDTYGDVEIENFLPLIDSPVSLSTQNPLLESVISVMQKALENGASRHIGELYDKGYNEYKMHKLSVKLTDEEKEFIRANPVIPFAAEYDNYPSSFFDARSGEWQGVVFDILKEVQTLTGLNFSLVNDERTNWHEILDMLETGKAQFVAELIWTEEREGRFLWPKTSIFTDRSVLISKTDKDNINIFKVPSVMVGLPRATAYAEFFLRWFPNNSNFIVYESQDAAYNALLNGEVDMVMSAYSNMLYITNYLERVDVKPNIIFDNFYGSTFGFHKDAAVLCSIFDKALDLIDMGIIADQWTNRTYDYRIKVAEAQRPLLIGSTVMASVIIALVVFIFYTRKLKVRHANEERDITIAFLRAEEASKAKTNFLAKMSHEIRTPMNAILGITEIQLRNENLPEEIEEGLEQIYDSGTLLLNIINDILDLSKIEAGKLDIIPVNYDIPSLINDVVQISRFRYDSKPIEFFLEVDENTPLNMKGDELRLKQVIGNILSNAFKYTDKGEIRMSVTSEAGQDDDVTLIITVSDTGQGMTDDQLDVLFEEYTRFNMDANRTTVGTGLGMNITKNLLDLMGGQISVTSEFGKGSCFTVRVPQKRINGLVCGKEMAEKMKGFRFQSSSTSKKSRMLREYMPYGSVLVVDDIVSNIYVTQGMLLPYGLKTDTASSGFEALEKVKAGNVYDIIFMDHMMPKMDGIEAAKLIREWEAEHMQSSQTAIIALTANALVGQAEMFLQNGFSGYISKPIDSRELNHILNEFIRNRKPPEVVRAARREETLQRSANLQNSDGQIVTDCTCDSQTEKKKMNSEVEQFFLMDAESAISVLESINIKNINDAELDTLEITVHGIKSALANIGETELSAAALKLEKAAIDRDIDFLENEIPLFIDELKSLIKKLS